MMNKTFFKINEKLENKQYVLQHSKRGFRRISYHPHYIMTEWVNKKSQAVKDGDDAIEKYWKLQENK